MDTRDLIGISEAARILGISRQAVHKRIRADTLKVVDVGGRKYVSRKSLKKQPAKASAGR